MNVLDASVAWISKLAAAASFVAGAKELLKATLVPLVKVATASVLIQRY